MNELFWNDPGQFLHRFGLIVLYAIVAWAVLAPLYIAVVYYVALPVMRAITRLKTEAAAKAAAQNPEHPVP